MDAAKYTLSEFSAITQLYWFGVDNFKSHIASVTWILVTNKHQNHRSWIVSCDYNDYFRDFIKYTLFGFSAIPSYYLICVVNVKLV